MGSYDRERDGPDEEPKKTPSGGVLRGGPSIEGVTNHTSVKSGSGAGDSRDTVRSPDHGTGQDEREGLSELSERERYIRRLLAAFRRYYNFIDPADLPEAENPLPEELADALISRCDFEVRNAQYVLTKDHELWSADSREHCYIFSAEHLTAQMYKALESYVYTEGMKLIHPKKGHMSTTLTLMIVCGSCDPAAQKLLKKCRLHKDFRFTLDGWMDFHTALAILEEKRAVTNFSGHENAKLMKALLEKKR